MTDISNLYTIIADLYLASSGEALVNFATKGKLWRQIRADCLSHSCESKC